MFMYKEMCCKTTLRYKSSSDGKYECMTSRRDFWQPYNKNSSRVVRRQRPYFHSSLVKKDPSSLLQERQDRIRTQQVEHMQVPNGRGPGIQGNERARNLLQCGKYQRQELGHG